MGVWVSQTAGVELPQQLKQLVMAQPANVRLCLLICYFLTYLDTQAHFHLFLDFENEALPGIVVPQAVFTSGDGMAGNFAPVNFFTNGQAGVRLQDCLQVREGSPALLDNAHDIPVLTNVPSARISIRISVCHLFISQIN